MIEAKNINFYYGSFHALKNISMQIKANTVTAFIGPSGCGKSTFLRLFNRMNDLIEHTRLEGICSVNGRNIYDKSVNVDELRKKSWYGISKTQSLPEVHIRKCSLRASCQPYR
ncbi:MAG: phosphate ABC transporter ATP-binding protein [Candidatus Parvibacillus calidus]|nr:MAG: phosphate ABC transporter ATP-binding protein [Candidatus Parvibacillus calidus]